MKYMGRIGLTLGTIALGLGWFTPRRRAPPKGCEGGLFELQRRERLRLYLRL